MIDIAPLRSSGDEAGRARAAGEIVAACREIGFFYAVGHGIPDDVLARLDAASRAFFALPAERKAEIAMARGGRAWRGWFPVGGELTAGEPDLKEGLYFGSELGPDDPRVRAGLPLHGANLFPTDVPALRPAVLELLAHAARTAQAILAGIARGLGLDDEYFRRLYTASPTELFRIFRYPPDPERRSWGVGEHSDYGLLTLLAQDDVGGLEVKTASGWIDAPPIPGTLVCNLGDMLDRLTAGELRSTLHRVRNASDRERLSFAYFFDPAFDARVVPLPRPGARSAGGDAGRWDGVAVHGFEGTYGDYLMGKVAKVFPELARDVRMR